MPVAPTSNGDTPAQNGAGPTTGRASGEASLVESREQLELEKLRAERDLATYQASRAHKYFEVFKTITSGAAALTIAIGLWVSTSQWNEQQEAKEEAAASEQRAERRLRDNASIESALADLSSAQPEKVSSAAGNLAMVFDCASPRIHRRAMLAAARTLAFLDEESTATIVMGLIERGAQSDLVDDSIKREALEALLDQSRALVREHDLWAALPYQEEPVTPAIKTARIIAAAMEALIQSGLDTRALDLADVYCTGCDFSGRDLSGSDFRRAILHAASFKESTLVRTKFNGAYLDWTAFVSADLRHASFGEEWEGRQLDETHKQYEERLVEAIQRLHTKNQMNSPTKTTRKHKTVEPSSAPSINRHYTFFHCADLRHAKFHRALIIGLSSEPLTWQGPSGFAFVAADLTETDFTKGAVWGLKRVEDPYPFADGSLVTSPIGDEFEVFWIRPSDYVDENRVVSTSRYRDAAWSIQYGFSGSTWAEAKLPPALEAILSAPLPSDRELDDWMSSIDCEPRSPKLPAAAAIQAYRLERMGFDDVRDWYYLRMSYGLRPDKWADAERGKRECLLEL